jgi:hypothetical protein
VLAPGTGGGNKRNFTPAGQKLEYWNATAFHSPILPVVVKRLDRRPPGYYPVSAKFVMGGVVKPLFRRTFGLLWLILSFLYNAIYYL